MIANAIKEAQINYDHGNAKGTISRWTHLTKLHGNATEI